MQTLIQDIRFASRMIWKRPTASAVIVLTLALGIGVNATFFSGFYGMVLRPLPFAEPQQLVKLNASQPALGNTRLSVSAPDLRDWIENNTVFEAIGAYGFANFNLHSDDEPERVQGAAISAALFPMLGVEPALGRNFLSEEDVPGAPAAVLVGHELWERHFAGDPAVIGRTLRLDDEPREIVGVMPPGFKFPLHGQIWTPLALDPDAEKRDARRWHAIARLEAGTTVDQAREAMRGLAAGLEKLYPE
ncbi:MAG: ABC transporter permease, partial [bacterium]|nr:ABC transporter permease [bacterium]